MLCAVRDTFGPLAENHYLGPTKAAKFGWRDRHGVMVFGNPRGRNVPSEWVELVRWCTAGHPNDGSKGWAAFVEWARHGLSATTIISYSDPSQGHTGALYRACNWLWAPTWHRLRPPPTGNGAWTEGERQEVKDRWVFPLREDDRRAAHLSVKDESLMRSMPWASYREPQWRKGRFNPRTGGGDFQRFNQGVRP